MSALMDWVCQVLKQPEVERRVITFSAIGIHVEIKSTAAPAGWEAHKSQMDQWCLQDNSRCTVEERLDGQRYKGQLIPDFTLTFYVKDKP